MDLPFTLFVVSDLHLEFCKNSIDKYCKLMPKKDVLILAGDIGLPNKKHFSRFLSLCSQKYRTIIFVPGNHEYYSEYEDEEIEEICIKNGVIMLQNEILIYEDVVFIGTTLWTNLQDKNQNELSLMNDFHYIPWLNTKVWNEKHKTAINFIQKMLNEYHDKDCIVITHHAPSIKCISEEYKNDILNICFFTDLEYLFENENLKCWIFGHTHKTLCSYFESNDTLLFGNSGRNNSSYKFKNKWFYDQDYIWGGMKKLDITNFPSTAHNNTIYHS